MESSAEFFDALAVRGHEPLLEKASGTIRFDVVRGRQTERWFLSIDKGDIAVSRRNQAADCIVRADRELFERVVRGEVNAFAALLRGELDVEGSPLLLVLTQRLLPGPPARKRRRAAGGRSRR
jgi:putative sterol carrier protein